MCNKKPNNCFCSILAQTLLIPLCGVIATDLSLLPASFVIGGELFFNSLCSFYFVFFFSKGRAQNAQMIRPLGSSAQFGINTLAIVAL